MQYNKWIRTELGLFLRKGQVTFTGNLEVSEVLAAAAGDSNTDAVY